jgi:plastocyanin
MNAPWRAPRAAALPVLGIALILGTAMGWRGGFAAPAVQTQVTIQGYAFSPARLTVRPGTTVVWINRDSDAHTVTDATGPQRFQSPGLDTGAKFAVTFRKAGTYQYFCSVHPFMHGTIIVR